MSTIIEYDKFCELVANHITTGDQFYYDLLETIIDNPSRYCGLFRLSNTRTKIIQNVTQSREIKFGDIMEELITDYIQELGYQNRPKELGKDKNGDELKVDQYFTDPQTDKVYIVEMKMRDDHDSTKKRGQYENFHKKIELVKSKNPGKPLVAIMWFVDQSLTKSKNYYFGEMEKDRANFPDVTIDLCYGGEFFNYLRNGKIAWNELLYILETYRNDNSNVELDIPDFGTDSRILDALTKLDDKHWNKLMSDKDEYKLLRRLLFASGDNLKKAGEIRSDLKQYGLRR